MRMTRLPNGEREDEILLCCMFLTEVSFCAMVQGNDYSGNVDATKRILTDQ